jgi:hypothetical protein
MAGMRVAFLSMLVGTALWCGAPGPGQAATPSRLSQRVWVLGELPQTADLEALRSAGISSLAIPVGSVQLHGGASSLTLAPLPDAKDLTQWSVAALVWVQGSGSSSGDASRFVTQLGPVMGTLPAGSHVLLVAREYADGVPAFARAVAAKMGKPVELAMAVADLAAHLPRRGWAGVVPVAVTLGNPDRMGFPATTRQDDLMALDKLQATGSDYRTAVVVVSRATPPPASATVTLATLATGGLTSYRPGAKGDVFKIEKPVDWGGTRLESGQQVELELYDTVRFDRDLKDLLRPARAGFVGLDVVGLPAPEPTLGLSRQAFIDYLNGGMPYPQPRVFAQWSNTTLRLAIENPGPQASSPATTGNFVEVKLGDDVKTDTRDGQRAKGVIDDVSLGDFSGVEYGRWDKGVFKRTNASEAEVVRFYLTAVCPYGRASGAWVKFTRRPESLLVRCNIRLGDGTDLSGAWQPLQ